MGSGGRDKDVVWLMAQTGARYRGLLHLKRRFNDMAVALAKQEEPDNSYEMREACRRNLLNMITDYYKTKDKEP